jgi:hypothetical protein
MVLGSMMRRRLGLLEISNNAGLILAVFMYGSHRVKRNALEIILIEAF